MPSIKVAQTSNSNYAPKYVPTAVFVGGTSGIGRAMAEALAKQTNGNANIVIVGRNKAAADEIISSFPVAPQGIKHEFVSCDAQEMKNIHQASQVLLQKLDKINLLVLSAGFMAFSHTATAEGHDVSLALRTYSRVKFTIELLPLLEKAKAAGEDARVMSVLAAAKGGSPDLQDLGLSNWSFPRSMVATGTYNDIATKVLSEQHPNITFIHIYPGLVDTPALRPNWWVSAIATVIKPFLAVSPETCAQFMLYPLLSPDYATGGYWMTEKAEKLAFPSNLEGEVTTKVWEHLLTVTKTE